jgi:heme A synthase
VTPKNANRLQLLFARASWCVLAYEVIVVAWGAYVRATGSGAGCGRHWPLCNGVVVPRSARVETLIELSHRLSSGLAVVFSVALLAAALRWYPRGHRVRRGAAAATAFMFGEALIGAALVLFELVARDASLKRALSVSLHLVNTFLLLASTALTAWWASGGAPMRIRKQGPVAWAVAVPLFALLFVGASGAVTALGDTLFPSATLAEGFARDFSPGAHAFVRLRALHPVLAVTTSVVTLASLGVVRALRPAPTTALLARIASALVLAQVALGIVDVMALAPIWVQLAHLVVADAVWIALVLTGAAALADPDRTTVAAGEPCAPARPTLAA